MKGWLDHVLVGLALLGGFGYTCYSLGPKFLRARLLAGGASLLRRVPAAGVRTMAERVTAAAAKAGGSCGGCDNCGSNDAATAPRTEPVAAREVIIPLSTIGRRRPG
jgi:hypothetical protein